MVPEGFDRPDRSDECGLAAEGGSPHEPEKLGRCVPTEAQSSAAHTESNADSGVEGDSGSEFTPCTGSARDPRQQDVFCPLLGAFVKDRHLSGDAAGRVRFIDVDSAMRTAGISLPLRLVLASTAATTANRFRDIARNIVTLTFNLYRMRGGVLAHKGDSGILNGGRFDERRFSELVAHSEDGKTMTIADIARATIANGLRDGCRRATVRGRANLAAITLTLGYVDANGVRRIDIQTLRDLYENEKLSFNAGRPPGTGLLPLVRAVIQMGRFTPPG